jgi:hypothetical protein
MATKTDNKRVTRTKLTREREARPMIKDLERPVEEATPEQAANVRGGLDMVAGAAAVVAALDMVTEGAGRLPGIFVSPVSIGGGGLPKF